jgi:hypothetical protein
MKIRIFRLIESKGKSKVSEGGPSMHQDSSLWMPQNVVSYINFDKKRVHLPT